MSVALRMLLAALLALVAIAAAGGEAVATRYAHQWTICPDGKPVVARCVWDGGHGNPGRSFVTQVEAVRGMPYLVRVTVSHRRAHRLVQAVTR